MLRRDANHTRDPHGIGFSVSHEEESFEAIGRIVYVSYGLGMGVAFTEVMAEQQQRLDRWLSAASGES